LYDNRGLRSFGSRARDCFDAQIGNVGAQLIELGGFIDDSLMSVHFHMIVAAPQLRSRSISPECYSGHSVIKGLLTRSRLSVHVDVAAVEGRQRDQ
jgi:hypothetical protein